MTRARYLAQRFELGLHDELVFTQLAAAGVGALDPLLQTALVDEAQAPCAVAGGDQRTLVIAFTVANPASAREKSHRREGGRTVVTGGRSTGGKLAGRAIGYCRKLDAGTVSQETCSSFWRALSRWEYNFTNLKAY